MAATKLGGEIMGRPGELGLVQAGALADLLLVDGDPLADIAILQDRTAIRMIMKDGALHKVALKDRLLQTGRSASGETISPATSCSPSGSFATCGGSRARFAPAPRQAALDSAEAGASQSPGRLTLLQRRRPR